MILIVNNYTDNVHLGQLQMAELGRYLQQLCGQPFLVKKYNEISGQFLRETPQIKAIILGGCSSNWDNIYFDIFEGEFEVIRQAQVPVLGICAGLQLMAMAYDGCARRADFGKEERFFIDVQVVKDSILTQGIEGDVYAFAYHYWMVPELPNGFELLMSSKKTKIQAMKRIGEEKFGVQFHPELDAEAKDPFNRARDPLAPNGEMVLKNFLSLIQ